ncbi:pyruvate dehydrogenase complex E1 component subunit beta [Gloeobacter violaceus]|uniref:Pyruvate dehydrogenase E1 component beta n=1 Tax=Gloeobacter violaceus (strain ATCC 29082 / PCC 7421) TaxID=251221 RepID=Q7NKE8_GLOVI|nr:pyruvate dehydrogenase complex E1 component subunit beta [Gloeobacter violaceus]BAC89471.1 pyruvate dehydrogenase E1 component beta [Gloeobacter violaceus PCC 7421]
MPVKLFYEALKDAMAEEMRRDPNVYVLGEDVGHYGGSYKATKDLYKEFGELRLLDTPICENAFTGLAVGSAMTGLRPIIEGMNMGFLLLAFNQIANNGGMLRYTSGGQFKIPMVVRGPGGVGKQLGAEHSQRLEGYFNNVPGLKIVHTSTVYNAKGLLKAAIRDDNPVMFFEHVLLYNLKEDIPEEEYLLPLDKAEMVKEGRDVTVLTYGRMRHHCTEALQELAARDIDVEVIDLISLKPLDLETIGRSLKKTHRVVIVEEDMKSGGVGAEIVASIDEHYFDYLDAPVLRLASKDVPVPYNGRMEATVIPQPQDIVQAVENMLALRV